MFISSTFYAQKIEEVHIKGSFISDDNNRKIIFNDDAFVFSVLHEQAHMSPYPCTDTIAFGTWKLNKKEKLLRLQSPEYLVKSIVFFDVTEKVIPDVNTVTFEIYNELDNYPHDVDWRRVEYMLSVGGLLHFEPLDTINKITVEKKSFTELDKISLIITLTKEFKGWYKDNEQYFTLDYEILNPDANHFTISIPDLTACKVGSRLLNQDFVRVINKNKLEWNGVIYKRNKSMNNN